MLPKMEKNWVPSKSTVSPNIYVKSLQEVFSLYGGGTRNDTEHQPLKTVQTAHLVGQLKHKQDF